MKNFEINVNGRTHWISRSVSVTLILSAKIKGELYILANKRGPNTPDFQGYWNIPCGYLDYDETAEEAAVRELKEETGIEIPVSLLILDKVNSSPKENHQNVNIRYIAFINDELFSENFNFDPQEVEEVKWINIKDISNYKWAFNHLEILNGNDKRRS